jgi:hypothetical protein
MEIDTAYNANKGPQFITAGARAGEFLLSDAKAYNRGVSGVTFQLDETGKLTGKSTQVAAWLSPKEWDPGYLQRKHQMAIQRAADTVIALYGDEEYALVADYNFIFNDVHFNSDNGFGFGKQIGGKIGVIRDPFGKKGAPKYLGATTPIPGGSIKELSLSETGSLFAEVWIDEGAGMGSGAMYKSLFVWNAGALIQAALEAQGRTIASPFDRSIGAQQQRVVPGRYDGISSDQMFGWIYGLGNFAELEDVVTLERQVLPPAPPPVYGNDYTVELVTFTDRPMDPPTSVAGTLATRVGAYFLGAVSALEVGLLRTFGLNDADALKRMTRARDLADSVSYDGKGNALTRGLAMFAEGMIKGIADVPLLAADTLMRGAHVLAFAAAGGEGEITELPPISDLARGFDEGNVSRLELLFAPILQVAERNPLVSAAMTTKDMVEALVGYAAGNVELDQLIATSFGAAASQRDFRVATKNYQAAVVAERNGSLAGGLRELTRMERELTSLGDIANRKARDLVKAMQDFSSQPGKRATDQTIREGRNATDRNTPHSEGNALADEQLSVPNWDLSTPVDRTKFVESLTAMRERGALGTKDKVLRVGMTAEGRVYTDIELGHLVDSENKPLVVRIEETPDSQAMNRDGKLPLALYEIQRQYASDDHTTVLTWDQHFSQAKQGVFVIRVPENTFNKGLDALSAATLHEFTELRRLHAAFKENRGMTSDQLETHIEKYHNEARDLSDDMIQEDKLRLEEEAEESHTQGPAMRVQDPKLKALVLAHEDRVLSEVKADTARFSNAFDQVSMLVAVRDANGNRVEVEVRPDVLGLKVTSDGKLVFEIVDAKLSQVKDYTDADVNLTGSFTKGQKIAFPAIARGDLIDFKFVESATNPMTREFRDFLAANRINVGETVLDSSALSTDVIIATASHRFDASGLPIRPENKFDLAAGSTDPRQNPGSVANARAYLDSHFLHVWAKYDPTTARLEIEELPDLASTAALDTAQLRLLVEAARQVWIAAGADPQLLAGVQVDLQHLPAGELGQAEGSRIKLSADAAGWGWFVDQTPLHSEEFEATAGGALVLRVGEGARQHVDLLSVLVHEMGHTLGLADLEPTGFVMSGSLQAGERRLPRTGLLAVSVELPTAQRGTGLRVATPAPVMAAATAAWQPVAAMAALTGGNLAGGRDPAWATRGTVDWVVGEGAVLREHDRAQSHLGQLFALQPDERVLSFTLAGTALRDNSRGPADAFEVALLDAQTGLPVAGRVQLAGSDALVNLQTNGRERLAAGVTRRANADGSATYFVELPDGLAGRSVLLSFDLLGFAALGSSMTVRDVQLLADVPTTLNQAPTAAGSLASGTEDGTLSLGWANFAVADRDALPEGGVLHVEITSLPVDGELQRQQADGNWAGVAVGERFSQADLAARGLRFVPAANASGGPGHQSAGDGNRGEHYARIGFRAFDGELYSPTASLVIDVIAVADMPTLSVHGDHTVTGLEDAALALHAIVAGLVDNDGSETLVLTLTGLPDGFTLSDGTRSFTPSAAQRSVNLAGWQLDALTVTPLRDFNGSVALQLQATAIEGATGERATTLQTLVLQFVAVADAPSLSLGARDVAVSRELLATGWEGPSNTGTAATVVAGPVLEGWTVRSAAIGKQAAFEIWAANDRMTNDISNYLTVQPMAGNGSQWLKLTNGSRVLAHQTLGIERLVETIAGATYTLSFDYAGAPGFAVANTQIGIYVDGFKVGGYGGASPRTALSWQTLSFSFTGNGQERRVAIVLEGGDGVATSNSTQRGAMLDDIHLIETLPVGTGTVYGLADTAIALPSVSATLTDRFGSETLGLVLFGLPVGAVLSDGVRTAAGGAAIDLAGWDLTRLAAQPPAGFTGEISLTVRATSVETSNGARASVSQTLTVRVLPGTAVPTPAGVNAFVVTTTQVQALQTQGGSQAVTPPSAAALALLADARGQVDAAAEPVPLPKTAAEIAQAEAERARAVSDAWLRDLEERAKAQWQQLVGGK